MKKLVVKTAFLVVVIGGSILSGAGLASADTNRMCFGAANMAYLGPNAGGPATNQSMVEAMMLHTNANGDAGMATAVGNSNTCP